MTTTGSGANDWVSVRRALLNLARLQPKEGVRLAQRLQTIHEWLHAPQFQRVQLDELGIYIAGFLYGNEEAKRVDTLFFDPATQSQSTDHRREEGTDRLSERQYMLPYRWHEHAGRQASRSSFVDRLFLLQRTYQDPWGENGLHPPEYFLDIPVDPVASETTHHGGPFKELCTWLDAWHIEKQARDALGIHYVPYGELMFFMYAWRRLVRAGANTTSTLPTSGNIELALWQSPIWRELIDERPWSYEALLWNWVTESRVFIRGVKGATAIRFSPKDDFELLAMPQLDEHEVPADWETLGLVRRGGRGNIEAGPGLGPLLRYVRAFFPKTPLALEQFLDDVELTPETLFSLDATLGSLAERLTGPGSLHERLSRLHQKARFPVIPYYYWHGLEPGYRRTHMVSPLWSSFSNPMRVVRRQYDTAGGHDAAAELSCLGEFGISPKPVESTIIGASVLTIRPVTGLDWTLGPPETGGGDWEPRLRRVRYILERISFPQIDLVYYGQRRRYEHERAGEKRGESRLAHQLPNDLGALARSLEYHKEKLRQVQAQHPQVEIPSPPSFDNLQVLAMFLAASSQGLVYEQPDDCAKLLQGSVSQNALDTFVERLVRVQALLELMADPAFSAPDVYSTLVSWCQGTGGGLPALDMASPLFFPVEIRGLFPLMLLGLRHAFKLASAASVLRKSPDLAVSLSVTTGSGRTAGVRLEYPVPDDAVLFDRLFARLKPDRDLFEEITARSRAARWTMTSPLWVPPLGLTRSMAEEGRKPMDTEDARRLDFAIVA
jgi:hypothetical protein